MPRKLITNADYRASERKKEERDRRKTQKRAETTQTYTVRVHHGSEIEAATEKAAADAGMQPGRYLRFALIEKLQRDGYMAEQEPEEPEE